MLRLQEMLTILGYTSPLWLFCLYVLLAFSRRAAKGSWLRTDMLALPMTALVIALLRLHGQADSYDWRQDLGRGLLTYGIAWALGRFMESNATKKEPVRLEFLDAD